MALGIKNPFSKANDFDADTMVSLTDDGQRALDEDQVQDMREVSILRVLEEHSPRSMSALAKESKINIFDAKRKIMKLKSKGMIKLDYRE